MKARILCPEHHKDGQVVEVTNWSSDGRWIEVISDESPTEKEILYGVNYYKDLQFISEEITDWNEFRKQTSVKMMQALMSNPALINSISCDFKIDIVEAAIVYTDKLIEELQPKPETNER